MLHTLKMHQPKLTNYNSKLTINGIYLKLFSKVKWIGEVLRYGRKATPSTNIAKQFELIFNTNKIIYQND